MYKKIFNLIGSMIFCTQLWAFPCQYTISKECCWTEFNVTVEILDTKNKKVLSKLTVPANKSSMKSSFDCTPGQQLELAARFSPDIWDNDKDKVFRSKKYILLKSEVSPEDIAWHIPIVFPAQFAEVPLPLNTTNCKCAE